MFKHIETHFTKNTGRELKILYNYLKHMLSLHTVHESPETFFFPHTSPAKQEYLIEAELH